jgi:DNA adenine methylase
MINVKLAPFLKWPGGKRWLVPKYSHCFPKQYKRYFEPFLGGGAVFFFLNPLKATLSDINQDLITLYQVMRDDHLELAQAMRRHQELHCKEYYYRIRGTCFTEPVQAASRLLYLNRMCFNGMYRVNKAGQFNVPIGTKQNCIYDIDNFRTYSTRLKSAEVGTSDFATIIAKAQESDFVFVDSPYTIAHNQNCFIKYNEQLFTWDDQERLLKVLCSARDRGTHIMATNANYDALKKMYFDHGFYTNVIKRFSTISSKVDKRREQEELLITSYPVNVDV